MPSVDSHTHAEHWAWDEQGGAPPLIASEDSLWHLNGVFTPFAEPLPEVETMPQP
jgi:hypothetical protein